MKITYIKPDVEIFSYKPEEGYNVSVALNKDFVLIEGDDRNTLRASEEVTEFTDDDGEFTTGEWL